VECFRDGNRVSVGAACEGPIPNAGDTIWDGDGGEAAAPIEGFKPNAGDAVRDED